MRKTRRLTTGERWELGLFLTMVLVGCLCLTALLNLDSLPRLFAFTAKSGVGGEGAANATAASPVQGPVGQVKPVAYAVPAPTVVLPELVTPAALEPVIPQVELPTVVKSAADVKYFGGKKYRFVKTLRLRVTAYAPDSRCCWPYPGTTTASGLSVKTNRGRLVAADTKLIPMHALVSVPGYANGSPVPVLDRGGAIKGHRLDVLLPTFDAAAEWGSRVIDVKIYMPVSG